MTTLITRAQLLRRTVTLQIDGHEVTVPEGTTILDAAKRVAIDTPTLCYGETLTPVNVCRVCVVEVEGSRVLVPACSRPVEPGMVVHTDSERVRHSRKLVMELLGSSVDMGYASNEVQGYFETYSAEPERFGPAAPPETLGPRDSAQAGHHEDAPEGLSLIHISEPTRPY